MSQKRYGNIKVAVAYIRVSTSKQEIGPDVQRKAIEEWAVREGVQIASWHVDAGVSGATPLQERKALLEAITALREHKAGNLVVHKRDRIARDALVAGLVEQAVNRSNAQLISADGNGNGTSAADKFMRTVLDGASEYERALIRARTTAALAIKKSRGEKLGGLPPFGFQLSADGVHLSRNENEQEIITLVRNLNDSGFSRRKIVAALADRGVTSRVGKPLALTQVNRILAQ